MIHVVLVLLAAQVDPSEPPPPLEEQSTSPPLEEAAPPPIEEESAPPPPAAEEAPSRVEAVDPLVRCRALINDDELERVAACLKELAASDDADVKRRAEAMAEVVAAWRARPATSSSTTTTGVAASIEPPSALDKMIEKGTAEGVVAGSIGGAVAGFTIAGALASATRANEADSLPWLVAAPAVGALAGAAGSFAAIEYIDPEPTDVTLAWSTAMMGTAAGFNLQLAIFDGSPEIGTIPLRFVTVLGGGALGLGAGALLSNPIDASRGDIAVAHSAAFWGATLTTILLFEASALGARIEFPQGVLIGGAGALLPYAAALAAHPLIEIDYWPAWLIDAGGAAGVLTSFAALVVLAPTGAVNQQSGVALIGVGTAAGLALGSVTAVVASNQLRQQDQREGE